MEIIESYNNRVKEDVYPELEFRYRPINKDAIIARLLEVLEVAKLEPRWVISMYIKESEKFSKRTEYIIARVELGKNKKIANKTIFFKKENEMKKRIYDNYNFTLINETPVEPQTLSQIAFARVKVIYDIPADVLSKSTEYDFSGWLFTIAFVKRIEAPSKSDIAGLRKNFFESFDLSEAIIYDMELELEKAADNVVVDPKDFDILKTGLLNFCGKVGGNEDPRKIYFEKIGIAIDSTRVETLKNLTCQVIELNWNTWYGELVDKLIGNYYMTVKSDGERALLYFAGGVAYIVSSTLIVKKLDIEFPKGISFDDELILILDGEYMPEELEFRVFDLLYCGKNYVNEDFLTRFKCLQKMFGLNKEVFYRNKIVLKDYVVMDKNYCYQIDDYFKKVQNTKMDGLIFTPIHAKYFNRETYKWKQQEKATIDFLIKALPGGEAPYGLFSGIDRRLFDGLHMTLPAFYNSIIPEKVQEQRYFPIPFMPAINRKLYLWNPTDKSFAKPELRKMLNKDKAIVGEFLFVPDKSGVAGEWVLQKYRLDRKEEAENNLYFGNAFNIAEELFMNTLQPLTIESLTCKIKDDRYFKNDNEDYKVVRKVNNRIKGIILNKVYELIGDNATVIDLASGRGQDLVRYSNMYVESATFVEIDKAALAELVHRKNTPFKVDRNKLQYLDMAVNVRNVDLKNPDAIKKICTDRVCPADLVVCNFAIHYFSETAESMQHFVDIVDELCIKNGYFVFTTFDSVKILNELKKHKTGNIILFDEVDDGKILKYAIKPKFTPANFSEVGFGMEISVILPFTNGEYYTEVLVSPELMRRLAKNFELVESKNFASLLSDVGNIANSLSDIDREFIGFYRYWIYRKIK